MHPFRNPAFDATMGHNNNIFIATPPDTLHNFCAELMKSSVKFILTIVHNLGKIQEFSTIASRLEERVIDFCYVHDMPHVNWTKFKYGVMQYVQTSKQESKVEHLVVLEDLDQIHLYHYLSKFTIQLATTTTIYLDQGRR